MHTLITRLLLVIALTTGVAAAHLSLQQKAPDDPTIVSDAEASPQENAIGNKYHAEDQKNYETILPHKAEAEKTKKVKYEPGLMILLGVSLISAAGYLRRVSHQEKLRSRNE